MPPTLIYLHGFASSPGGTKAQFVKARCEERGVRFRAPDLKEPKIVSIVDHTATIGIAIDDPIGYLYCFRHRVEFTPRGRQIKLTKYQNSALRRRRAEATQEKPKSHGP
jgi:hypothetical protein